MRDWSALKSRYLQDTLPKRLGNLASNLARIKSRCTNPKNREVVESVLQESKLFIEWVAAEVEVDLAAELVELQIQLALWQYSWASIWDNELECKQIAQSAGAWSERVLNLSGLLTDS